MASPAKQARLKAFAKGFSEVVARGNNYIVTKNPTSGACAIDAQVGGGWHYDGDQETDTVWEPGIAPWNYQMVKANYNLFALSNFKSGQIIKWVDPSSGESVAFQPMSLKWTNAINQIQQISFAQNVQATVEDDKITWPGAYGTGRDFSYIAGPTRMQKLLKIDEALPTTNYDILELEFIMAPSAGVDIYINGEMWDKKTRFDTAMEVYFKSGENVLWSFAIPVAFDSAGNETSGILRLRKSGNSLYCSIRFPKTWIDSAVYPIYIDPTIDTQVAASADDGYILPTGSKYSTQATVYIGNTITYGYLSFFRWEDVVIPDGATIDSAVIKVYYDSKYGTPPQCDIFFEDDDNAAQITTGNDGLGRTKTSTSVAWTPPSSGEWVDSPSIVSIIQELMGSYSYASGAAMQALIVGPNGDSYSKYSRVRSYDYEGNTYGPKLHIEYSEGGPTTQTLTAKPGSFTLAGTKAQLLKSNCLKTNSGDFSLQGQTVNLWRIRELITSPGTYELTGGAANLLQSRVLSGAPGTCSLESAGATLLQSRILTCLTGSCSLGGAGVTFLQSRILTCLTGSHALAGTQANLLQSRILSGAPGEYILTGQPVNLIYTPAGAAVLVCRPGSFSIQGQTANMLASRVVSCIPDEFTLVGGATGLLASRLLSCHPGALGMEGEAGALLASRLLSCSPGALGMTGNNAILAASRVLSCHPGALGMTGVMGGLLASRVISCNPGALEIAGVPVQLIYTPVGVVVLVCRPGTFSLGSGPAQLLASRRLEAGPGTFDATGGAGGLLASRRIGARAGSFGLSAGSAMLLASRRLEGLPGAFELVGEPVNLIFTPWGTYYVPRRADSGIIKAWSLQSLIIKSISGDGEL